MEYFWPMTTGYTFIDVWSFAHLGFWVFISSTIWALKLNRKISFFVCVGIALAWEVFEKFAEHRWPDRWQDPESWVNSWVSDPLTCIITFWVVMYFWDRRRRRDHG